MATAVKDSPPGYEPAYGEFEPVRETDPLLIQEILIRVLELTGSRGKATAARVCRRWFNPALDTLWQDLTDVAPFLRMFPVLKSIENPRMSPAEMLERIKSYGARYLPMVSIPSSGLFPNLRTLEWRAERTLPHVESTLDAVSYFICPSLKHLYVSDIVEQKEFQADDWYSFFPGPGIDCAPFFRALNSMESLRMESLELQMCGYQQVLTTDDEIELFLRRHQESLRHLRAWDADLGSIFQKELWGLLRLRSLDVIIADEPEAALFIEGSAEGAFEMESLRLKILSCEQPRKWQELWDALKGLRKLTKLHLEIPTIGGLGERDVRSMKEAWPTPSYLYILRRSSWLREAPEARGLEREFLSAVTRHFSHSLTTLGLVFEPKIRSSTYQIRPVQFEKLQLLYIQSIFTPKDPEDLVRYFTQILPREAIFKADPRNGWDKVVDGLGQARDETPQEQ
ncbi:hypothetical protein FS837_001149 [Tulasnella sp. UAMH 9824]|nr:hypothetical protein FS837_001149 [Tulasnella sp. UAMH 9824]